MKIRIQKHLSENNILSRRATERAIEKGLITVNGTKAKIGQLVDPHRDKIDLHESLRNKHTTTIAFHKPRGILSNCAKKGEMEIRDLLPDHLKHLSTVGRLDKDSEGLILLTDDGTLAKKLLDPKTPHVRVYRVWTDKDMTVPQMEKLERGGVKILHHKTKPMVIRPIEGNETEWRLYEGKNRQIRRMAASLGLTVTRLKRIRYGPVKLDTLRPKKFRPISKRDFT